MKKISYLIMILLMIYFVNIYIINSWEKFITINKANIIGFYKFSYQNKLYKLNLMNKNNLIFEELIDNKIIKKEIGTWNIKYIHNTPYIDIKITNLNNLELSLGKVKLNLFDNKVKIEALSMGHFYGEEDGTFFIRYKE